MSSHTPTFLTADVSKYCEENIVPARSVTISVPDRPSWTSRRSQVCKSVLFPHKICRQNIRIVERDEKVGKEKGKEKRTRDGGFEVAGDGGH